MAELLRKCKKKDGDDCFARNEHTDTCGLLADIRKMTAEGKAYTVPATFFDGYECPFYKTAEEAGGTYKELCQRYTSYNTTKERMEKAFAGENK